MEESHQEPASAAGVTGALYSGAAGATTVTSATGTAAWGAAEAGRVKRRMAKREAVTTVESPMMTMKNQLNRCL